MIDEILWYGVVQVKEEKNVVLTKPLSLDAQSNDDFRAPNILQRVLSLFKNMRPGTDITRFKASLYVSILSFSNFIRDDNPVI